jgi:hypothetical protein
MADSVHFASRAPVDNGSVRPKPVKSLASRAEAGIFGAMSKAPRVRVVFKCKRIAEGDWQIEAQCPGIETRYIKGLTSKADADEWIQGTRRVDWLRSQGYAK